MKHAKRILGSLLAWTVCGVALGSCGEVPSTFVEVRCDSTPFTPNEDCAKQPDHDAGTDVDAATDAAESDASNAIDDPDLNTTDWVPPDVCGTGVCVPDPNGSGAILWEKIAISLWVGPADQVPAKCPDDPVYGVPTEKFRGFDKLVAPPATCSACSCEPSEGTCSGAPATLELRAGTCAQSGVATVPFDSPAGWDGSCTNADSRSGRQMPRGKPNVVRAIGV